MPNAGPASAERLAVVISFSGFSIVSKECHMDVAPYLFFPGNCEAAFKFYEKALGGKIDAMISHDGTPAEQHVPAEWRSKIMHARLKLGERSLMGSDAPPDHYKPMQGFSVTLGIETPAEAERVFNALSENGTVRMPLEKTFWAERFGMLVDQFGTSWMINCEAAK
jgi:PhnB protein